MICPIREISFKDTDDMETMECLEEECAWWIKRIVVSEKELDKAGCAIKKIAERML